MQPDDSISSNRTSRPHGFIPWCKRYISFSLVALVSIMVYILFCTGNSIPETYLYDRQIDQLKIEIRQAQDSLDFYLRLNSRLFSDPSAMEGVVREHFHMQHPGEEVYID